LNALLTIDDGTLTTSQNSVKLNIIEFESADYANTELHTIVIHAVTEQEYQQVLLVRKNYVLNIDIESNGGDSFEETTINICIYYTLYIYLYIYCSINIYIYIYI
jgi:hypothetical protein